MVDGGRERRKQALRSRVMDAQDLMREEDGKKPVPGVSERRRLVFLLPFGIIAFFLILIFSMYIRREYQGFSVNWLVQFSSEGATADSDFEKYELYADGFLKVTRDGAAYINSSGKTVWNQPYEVSEPYVSVNGNFAAVADQGRNMIYIMSADGTTGIAETALPITKISVSEKGVVYALLEDGDSSYISVFSREGGALDITIKSVLSGDGYPVDISVSPDGTELICSFAFLEGGTIENRVVFYNLSEVGQSAGINRVVGGFTDDFLGHLAGRVHFSDNTYAQAFYDGGVAFFSTKVLTSPELLLKEEIPNAIRSIAYSNEYVGIITDRGNTEDGLPYGMLIYRVNGQKVFEKNFAFRYEGFHLDKNKILLYNKTQMQLYDIDGRLRFDGELDLPIACLRVASELSSPFSMNVLVGSEGRMESVKLS